MDLELEGRAAIVTGATGGIGRAIAAALAAEGVSVLVNHLEAPEAAQDVCALVRGFGPKAEPFEADVADRPAVEAMVEHAWLSFGRLDVMVHNAGITTRQSILDTPPDDWDRVVQTNLYGAYHTAAAAGRAMVANSVRGSIIAISSLHGRVAKANMGAYCATKAGIEMLMKQLAVELAPHGIRANSVAPGTIDTGMNPVYHPTDEGGRRQLDRLLDRVPLRRLGEPEAIGRAVAFLASPVSSYTTGATLRIDGGYTADGTPR